MKILLIQRRALGDAIYTALVGKVIKTEIPEAKIYMLTLKPMCQILENYDFIYECIPFRSILNSIYKIRKRNIDIVFDYEATTKTYPIVLFSGASKRIAFYKKLRERFLYPIYTDILPYRNYGYTFWDRLELLKPLGINYEKYLYEKVFLENCEVSENYIVFVPKGKHKTKEISPEKVKEIKEFVERKYHTEIRIFVDPKETDYIKALDRAGVKFYTLDLKSLKEEICKSKGVISFEGFPYHLGFLLGKKTVVILQAFTEWFKHKFEEILYYRPPLECLGCRKKVCPKGTYECTYSIDTERLGKMVARHFNIK